MKTLRLSKLARLIRLHLAGTDRDSTDPTQWMPVPFPGLSEPQLEALMREVDRRPFTPSPWLRGREYVPARNGLRRTSARERDPRNPLHWMPVPPPVISREQVEARAEAFGLN